MRQAIRKLASRIGYDIAQLPCSRMASQADFDSASRTVAAATMLTPARQATLFDQVLHCEKQGIPGAIVECGVWKGGAIGLAGLALKLSNTTPTRQLHLFDVFADICAPDPAVDGSRAMREFGQTASTPAPVKLEPVAGAYDTIGGHGTVELCRDLIESRIGYPSELVHYHVGWFQDTLPVDAQLIGPIAVLRLDGDWYASTKVCLDYLYDLVQPGGFVIIDDYGAYEGCKRAVDEFVRQRGIDLYLHRVDASCYYLQK